ncbi:Acetoin utilization deacetylase AcuC [Desulfonatronum thiosulfatophilum]|uniref:Acetoin utilization deacetylase AcuC n=1 Tax=Desulfonatronum thiosulfatophilum TaxID=617002 RepID=A0A1G6C2I3_9BACT|nr:histone deacetylase family protein [Desulfonatronum thiosulfatophilum]SDB27081.1 Acetoin utilization deacetylase AcuC [Desulfonatronum thiosulfatophilum]
MFRIRRVQDATWPGDARIINQVQDILREQFPLLSAEDLAKLPEQLSNPLKFRFRTILFAAEGSDNRLKGFALLMHAPDLHFGYLDFISAAKLQTGAGVGGALYARVREEAKALGLTGIYFECLPDDPALCPDASILKQNKGRLRFYERFGAKPIAGTAYETPFKPGDSCPPYLVFDPLDRGDKPLRRKDAQKAARAILERKYAGRCPPGYVDMVVESFQDDPVLLREPRYEAQNGRSQDHVGVRILHQDKRIALVVNDRHDIHHVHERGYVEAPVRIKSILKELEPLGLFQRVDVRHFGEEHILAVHDRKLVEYLKRASALLKPGESVYPYVFPIRNAAKPPRELPVRAGYFCIDTFTPINHNAYLAARRAVDCALTATLCLREGYRAAYALVRPPGHHAERRVFGGFCYFNSAAAAAHNLSSLGKVAVLDIDYHHGNGTQDIFYHRDDVLTVSLHGHPRHTYPYFSGYEEEKGEGPGIGCNMNIALPEGLNGESYREELARAVRRIKKFAPRTLIIALGLDPAKDDPTGSWTFTAKDFERNGRMLGELRLPTLVVQEGGYRIRSLGNNAKHFFLGLAAGLFGR